MVENEESFMAFSTTESPVYGGNIITIEIPEEANVRPPLYFVYEGSNQRHITLGHYHQGKVQSLIPEHDFEEQLQLNFCGYLENELCILATSVFQYYKDSTYYLAWYLIDSVYNSNSLDDLELIRSDNFDLSNEILDTLDDRLYTALTHLEVQIPEHWTVIGDFKTTDLTQPPDKSTLLHFTAQLGLIRVASFFLDKPGGDIALKTPNRHGYLPREIAAEHGYTELTELLTEYSQNFVRFDRRPIFHRHGIIHFQENGDYTLTTYLQKPIAEDIHLIQAFVDSMNQNNSGLIQSQTDWPEQQADSGNNLEENADSTLNDILQKSKDIHVAIETLGDLDKPENKMADQDGTQGDLDSERRASIEGMEYSTNNNIEANAGYEGSLADLHGFNQQIFRLRDYHRNKFIQQDVRKDKLSRNSSSCPSLQNPDSEVAPAINVNEGHHSSMHNLAKDEEQSVLAEESTPYNEELNSDIQIVSDDDSRVQICVNGITLDSSDDIRLDTSLNRFIKDYYGDNTPGVRRRSSWCPQTSTITEDLHNKYVNQSSFSQGKSASLNQLDGDDSDDSYHDAKEDNISTNRQNPLDMDAISISPSESGCSSPFYKEASDERGYEQGLTGDSLIGTLYHLQQELVTPRDKKKTQVRNLSEEINQSGDSEEENSKLTVPQHSSNMTKAQSTPSIPHAVSTSEKLGHTRDPKQPHHRSYLYIQKLIEEHDAQFRRQREIEEDDDENTNRMLAQEDRNKKSKLSLLDFLNDSSLNEEQKLAKKEEKKRKTSVFSRISSSYRTKKHKDKEGKGKNTHQFVSVSVSNSTPCAVCNKSMANKLALRCENCLINVHESSCKEQVTTCGRLGGPLSTQSMKKNKQPKRSSFYRRKKLPPREGGDHRMLKEKQHSASSVTGLRHTQSFKDNRSASAPSRSQVTSTPLSASIGSSNILSSIPDSDPELELENPNVIHRLSLPPSSLSSQLVQAGYIPWRKAHKFHNVHKPIDEDLEQETFRGVLLQGSSTDGPPESHESSDEIDAPSDSSSVHITDDFLSVYKEEPEHWSVTVDKKILKKMNSKDIKRQDTIWELIQTERHHCRTLKILQKVYSQGILHDLLMPPETVDKLFPKLDELIDIHMTFLQNLQDLQNKRPDHSVEFIGDTLVRQFNDESAESMKKCYGAFCANQKESVQFYKDLLIKDRKFVTFIQRCSHHSLCKKRDIPSFLLLVTQRPTKYPILIEHILKSTKDKKDRENLSKALQLSKELLQGIDEHVDAYELKRRLSEIYQKLDSKSFATYKNRKFKRSDIYSNNRSLVYDGQVHMRSARGKHTEVICVVLTDLIFFLQDVNGRYNFQSQDDKSCVIPLFELLVREKCDTRDSRGIYLISHNKKNPEMYEIVCNTSTDRQKWISILQKAATNCPPDSAEVDEEDSVREEQRRLTESRSAKVNEIIEQLHKKDYEIKQICDDKNKLMVELLEIYSCREENRSQRPGSMEDEGTEHMEALQAALQEVSVTASHLTTILQGNNGNGSQLSRHVSSVGEHFSNSYQVPPVPKRAETFAGFDSQFEVPKALLPKKKQISEDQELEGQTSSSLQNLDRAVDSDSELSQLADVSMASYKQIEHDDSMDSSKVYDRYSSDNGSYGDMSGSSTYSMWVSGDHVHSIAQLSRSLQSIVHLTEKQVTAVESLRAQLAEANEKINNLSAEVHDRKGGLRHNQLEELRNLQEEVRRDRQKLEKEKERERMVIEHERTILEEERKELDKKESELQNHREDLKRKKEMLQRQQDLWEEAHQQSLSKISSSPGMTNNDIETRPDKGRSSPANVESNNSHRRSASADFCQLIENDMENLRQGHLKTSRRGTDVSRSDSRASIPNSSFTSNKMNLPIHLISAKNEQKVNPINPQQIPTKLSGQNSASSLSHKLPFKLASSNSASSLPTQGSSSQLPTNASSSSLNQKSYTSNRANTKLPGPSQLMGVMKLAQPGGAKGKSPVSNVSSDGKQGSPKQDQKGNKSDGVIYF
ncbi:A-kinase anchor protein 13-like isoform X3 [Mytilus californianus]|uniref:A-kinase anchor protein 13-like isoform X3 n=1 Tax=Mytilus californianus TaxID=6549 RepID=UPI002246BFE9|nr:A-kinase anchor protein 13-like isoform X3 [Mytilus californianus]